MTKTHLPAFWSGISLIFWFDVVCLKLAWKNLHSIVSKSTLIFEKYSLNKNI